MPRQHRRDLTFAESAPTPELGNCHFGVAQSRTGRSRAARDAALHAARRLYAGTTTYQAAKDIQRDLRAYLSRCWPREKYLGELPVGVSELRVALHRLACVNDGKELSWRRIYDILSCDPMAVRR